MVINILYLGLLSEKVGSSQEEFNTRCNGLAVDLKKELEVKYPELRGVSYRMAINKNLTEEQVKDGDEVALLPQFAGG